MAQRLAQTTEESTAAGIYGVIVGAAVMAASHADSVAAVEAAVLVTLLIYWVAERYARLVAARIHSGHRPSWPELRRQLSSGWEIISASTVPLVVLALLGLLGAEVEVAVLAALGCSTALLCLAGWEMGRDGRLSAGERVTAALVAGSFGLVMILLKTLLH
jgi:hypothetical protein